MSGDATQDRFLGAILGMAIGDAFGMPVAGLNPQTIADLYGNVQDYLPRTFSDGESVNPGEITDDTELALCVIESITVGQGQIDVENIGIRMSYLARSDSRRWMNPDVAMQLDGPSEASGFRLPLRDDSSVAADVLTRGIPLGLLYSLGPVDRSNLAADVEAITRITHSSPLALKLVEAAAVAVSVATRAAGDLGSLAESVAEHFPEGAVYQALTATKSEVNRDERSAAAVLAQAIDAAATAESFENAIQTAVQAGGPADSRAALSGALYAGHHGSSVIPQRLIDNLESRIYVSLAVPWFYRTVAKRSGRMVNLRRTTI